MKDVVKLVILVLPAQIPLLTQVLLATELTMRSEVVKGVLLSIVVVVARKDTLSLSVQQKWRTF